MTGPLTSDVTTLADFLPPAVPKARARNVLFSEEPSYNVQTSTEAHQTKKRSGSSDGAQTYDTPVT